MKMKYSFSAGTQDKHYQLYREDQECKLYQHLNDADTYDMIHKKM